MPGEAPEFLHRWGSNSRGFPPVLHKVPKTQSNLKELTQCLELLGIKPHDLTIVLYSIGGGATAERERRNFMGRASMRGLIQRIPSLVQKQLTVSAEERPGVELSARVFIWICKNLLELCVSEPIVVNHWAQ